MIDRLLGVLVAFTAVAVVLREWTGASALALAAGIGMTAFIAIATPRIRASRQVFVAAGLVLLLAAAATRTDWLEITNAGLQQAAFIAAFFIALASLRNPASTSPGIERCGQFLASRPPGKRYLALTLGGHLFSLILSYGTITLLGGLTESIARQEENEEIRRIRNRRMLLAIQRGMVAMLAWSPLAFAMAIATSVIPGASWSGAVGLALVSSALLTFIGWALDTAFKPRPGTARPPQRLKGSWHDLKPLIILLILLFGGVGLLELASGLRVIAVVMLFVPALSLAWIAIQGRDQPEGVLRHVAARSRRYVLVEVPSYVPELVLLSMAGFIGTVGAELLAPLLAEQRLGLTLVPGWLILVSMVWLIPIAGQLGMNPILFVSLFAPLLPSAEALGVEPNEIVVAITSGWALSGASSPFTATTLLVGRLGNISAFHVGWVWNRGFMIAGCLVLSLWIAIVALA